MHELIERYFTGTITDDEKKNLFSIMKTDNDVRKEFISTQNLCALSALLPDDNDQIKAELKLKRFKLKRSRKTIFKSLRHVMGYAAAVLIAVISTWAFMDSNKSSSEPEIVYEEFITPAGQRAMLKLHDGTTVWLNAKSTLRYPNIFTKERRVELNGEAYFEVAHNEEKPFIVSTEKLDIEALGTEFNVHAYRDRNEFNTSLVEGSVKIYNRGNQQNALFITPNEYAELVDNKLVKKSFNNMDFLLWREGVYAFDDLPFMEIIRRLELYYDITIHVKNQQLASYKFTGKIRQRDGIESVLRTLQKVYYFRFVKDEVNNTITI